MGHAVSSALYSTAKRARGKGCCAMAVKPHDFRAVKEPAEIDAEVAEILGEDAADLAAEVDQLDRAHNVLRDALQEN